MADKQVEAERIEAILEFLREADGLKAVYRAGYLADGSRHESGAEHVWHACLFAVVLHREMGAAADLAHSIELLIVHDLVEVYAGDTPLHDEAARAAKEAKEAAAADRLFALLPRPHGRRLRAWWEEYEEAGTPEARFANEIDRLQAVAQNVSSGGKTWDDWKVSETQARERNQKAMGFDPQLQMVFEILFEEARSRDLFSG